jgi:hypothetical protein
MGPTMPACPDCGAATSERRVALEYAESLVPDVVLVGIAVRTCACGYEDVDIPQVDELHTLMLALRSRRPGTLRLAFRDGRWTEVASGAV